MREPAKAGKTGETGQLAPHANTNDTILKNVGITRTSLGEVALELDGLRGR